MKTTSPTGRASPLARSGFHPHFTCELNWRASSGKRPDIFTSSFCYGLKLLMNNALAPKCLALMLGLALFVVFIWKIFSSPTRDLG